MRVLIVEDMRQMRELLTKMMHKTGQFEAVDSAEDGEAAWEKLTENAAAGISYDIVLCDVNMDRLNGLELLKRCRRHADFQFLPFLMISGAADEANIASAMGEWGAHDFIVKPISYGALCTRVTTILKRAQSPEEVLFRHVEALKREGATDEALALIDKAEMMNRISLAKWINAKGECFMQAGEIDKAAAEFEKATEISSIYLAAYKNCSVAHRQMGNIGKAIEVLERMETISPRDNERTFQLGQLLLQNGREEDGKQYFQKMLKRCTGAEKDVMLNKVAQTFLEGGLFEEAESMYMECLESSNPDPEIYNRLAVALRQQGKYEEAQTCYLKALKMFPNHAGLYHNLGILHLARKEPNVARKHLEKALSLDPELAETRVMLKKLEQMSQR